MPEPKSVTNKYIRLFLLAIVIAGIVSLIVRNITVFGNVLLVIMGFGTVILVHEFGHFIFAKLSGIKVEAFSLGFSPVLAGIKRTEQGIRIRILPGFFPTEDDNGDEGDEDDGPDGCLCSFTIGKEGRAGETEYRIGLIPFGGFVKMLGQDDTKAVETGDDPRSYVNKPVSYRMAVIAAGVVFNAISAVVIFMIVFMIGIRMAPPVVGGVSPGSPAAKAGLRGGDEVIEIAGKSRDLDFTSIGIAAALSGKGEEVELKVRHEDGLIEDISMVAEQLYGMPMRLFGVTTAQTLIVGKVSDPNSMLEKTGLLPADKIKTVNGENVQTHWQMKRIIGNTFKPTVTLQAERTDEAGKSQLVQSVLKLKMPVAVKDVNSESELYHIYSIVPRLQINGLAPKPRTFIDRLKSWLSKTDTDKIEAKPSLETGDIILAIGDTENPTYKELRDITQEHWKKNQEKIKAGKAKEHLPIRVIRTDANGIEQELTIPIMTRWSKDLKKALLGIGFPVLDLKRPVVAKTIDAENGSEKLSIPRGAMITAVDGVEVSNFYDVIKQIKLNAGQQITIDYRLDDEVAGDVVLNVGKPEDAIALRSVMAEFVPFAPLEKLYKAEGPFNAVAMGYRKTVMFIAQAYVTLKRFVSGDVSPKNFMGPVGIATTGYRLVTEMPSLVYYVYFIGLISVFIAVFNSLPVLPFDGGHLVFLFVEKIKGSPVNPKIQLFMQYFGLVVILAFALYITFNDIVRSFFS